jgi:hypothetical protein
MPSKKALEKALQKEKEIREQEEKRIEDESWEIGTNKRLQIREQNIQEKQQQKMQKAQELKQLYEEENSNIPTGRPSSRKGIRAKKNDLKLLNESLASIPKTKIQKEADRKQKEKEERKFEQLRLANEKEERNMLLEKEDYLLRKKGIIKNQNLTIEVNNLNDEDSIYASNIDDALDAFESNCNNNVSYNKEKLYKEFYNEHLPILKTKNPGLRLSQYQEKIYKMWKISFSNPDNK